MITPNCKTLMTFVCLVRAIYGAGDSQRLHELLANDWSWQMREYPEQATLAGYPGQNDRWTDLSAGAITSRRQHPQEVLSALQAIDRAQLNREDQLNYDLFLWKTQREVEGQAFPS